MTSTWTARDYSQVLLFDFISLKRENFATTPSRDTACVKGICEKGKSKLDSRYWYFVGQETFLLLSGLMILSWRLVHLNCSTVWAWTYLFIKCYKRRQMHLKRTSITVSFYASALNVWARPHGYVSFRSLYCCHSSYFLFSQPIIKEINDQCKRSLYFNKTYASDYFYTHLDQ